ncbi:TetR/AcrR family transcriptional regulator [Klenkia brasiliensis]|uniref:Transcriptional regulator, TetR family n=1 Tax=Klenkia brasiliensis TaxID=333142 RepID=A0A1G7YRE2_9ACTN|nr:TetR/AcrR family transcriptional regulator [Klenkia brasiliensis]SDG98984.1 transcriptional regulator, TetR family [Klenkia brasiliensis]
MSEEQASAIGRRRAAAQDGDRAAYRERRQEIIAAAAGLFKSHGFRGTSIGQIAEALGTDRATLYYYVGSKEELFDEVVSDAVRANVARAEAIRDGAGDAPDKLRRLVTELMDSYAASYPFLYVFIQENLSHVGQKRADWSAEMRGLNRAYQDCVTAIIESGIAEGTIRPVAEPWVLAYGLIGMVGWTNRWFNPEKSDVDAATIGRAYADVLLDGLTAR